MMKNKKLLILAVLVYAIFTSACIYIVLPEGLDLQKGAQGSSNLTAWSAFVTNVTQSATGDLHIDITIKNDTGDWSTMRAVENKPATLTNNGKTSNCATVFVSTGGHRLAPGFQMRGYTSGSKSEPKTQLLYVECKAEQAVSGAKLVIDYVSFEGELDDYKPEDKKSSGKLELNLDDVVTDLTYPVADLVEGSVLDAEANITGLSDNVVSLLEAQRSEDGFLFTWQNINPTKFALKTHIGIPPVIGSDGIIYGVYEILDIAPVPLTPANENIQWETEVAVPQDIKDCYILLSVESKKPRTYLNYAIDITDK
jgi:predicted small secreted protein